MKEKEKKKWKLLSCVQLLATHGLCSPWNSPCQNTGVGSLSLLQGIFPSQGSNPGFRVAGRSLQAESQGKPKNVGVGSLSLLQWIFLTQELNQVSCIAGRCFTNWAIREAFFRYFTFIGYYRILSRVPFAYSRSLLFIYFIHSFLMSLQVKTKVKMMADRLLLAASLPRGLLPPAPCSSAPVTLASLMVFSHTVKWLTPAPFHLLFPYDLLPHWF